MVSFRYNATMQVKTRFAPSPTGIPHIGSTRTAFFDFLFARKNEGKFILRIEDTDQKRKVAGSEEAIDEILDWLGISPDGKFRQSERLSIYKKYAKELLDKKIAFEKEGAIYVRVPDDLEFSWTDAVGNKKIKFSGKDVENFVILKSDGFPTYHLANVVDDYLMEITHVMRGEEWIPSTSKHLFLYESFNWKPPVFVHLPVILGPDKSKLSKRHGAKSVLEFRSEGFLKEAILNFMALLGWNPGGDKEILDLEKMINLFDLKDINVSNPVFDNKKLEWMNGVYIRKYQISDIKHQILQLNPELKKIDDRILDEFIKLSQTRMTTLKDFQKFVEPFFNPQKPKLNNAQLSIVIDLKEKLGRISKWNQENIFQVLKEIFLSHKIKMNVLYKIFTDSESGLPLPQSLEILGKEKTLERL